jgi:LacI family transcriptional regulator
MNLKEFAAQLGLSVTTVSRALNDSPVVEAKTRQRIIAEAQRLNYTPSSAARRLATGRSNAFGLVLELERNLMREALFREFLVGLFEELSKSQSDLIIKPAHVGDLKAYESFYHSGRVDGFVLTRPTVDDARISYLWKKKIPFVVHGPARPGAAYSFLTVDNAGSIHALASVLADLGHRRVAFLNDQLVYVFAQERQEAFEKVASARGFEPTPGYARQLRMDERGGYDATRELLANSKLRPTAVICGSILLAEGAYRAIADAGLQVGRDVSVVAHDDVSADLPADRFRPALTATEGPLAVTGVRLAEFLVRLAKGEKAQNLQETLPVKLVYRASAQAPSA